jgi:hypothetical protein
MDKKYDGWLLSTLLENKVDDIDLVGVKSLADLLSFEISHTFRPDKKRPMSGS